MATKKTHGGKRKGSGRKSGKRSTSKSISMLHSQWEKVDKSRGTKPRGKWIGDLVDRE